MHIVPHGASLLLVIISFNILRFKLYSQCGVNDEAFLHNNISRKQSIDGVDGLTNCPLSILCLIDRSYWEIEQMLDGICLLLDTLGGYEQLLYNVVPLHQQRHSCVDHIEV
eukprot:370483_1